MGQTYKYFAFISYNSNDAKWVQKIQRKLEHYRMPTTLCNKKEWTKTPAHSYATDIEPSGNIFIRRDGSWWHEDKNCRVSRRYASDHSKKTSGLGLRVIIRDNVE